MFSFTQNYLTRGFWGDEAWTSLISQLPYLQMLKTTAADFHPPAYYTIVEILYKFLPPTEVNTRLISIIFYLLTIYLVFRLASFIRGHTFGLLSATAVALNPIFFTYAFEARNYTMFAFAATGSVYYLIRLLDHLRGVSQTTTQVHLGGGVRLGALLVLFSTLGIYTHYYMFFVLASQFLYILLLERRVLARMIGLYTVVGLLYLPWIPFLYSQVSSVSESYWIGGIDSKTHFEALLRILGGEHKNLIRPILFWLSAILLLTGILQHVFRRKFKKPYILIWFWAIVPFILATLPGLKIAEFKLPFRSIFFWRYLIPSSIPFALIMIHTLQKFPKRLMFTLVTVLIVLSLIIDFMAFKKYPYTFKQVYENKIIHNINSGDKIVTVLPSFAEVLYYKNQNKIKNELVVLPVGLVQFSGKSLLDAYIENKVVRIEKAPTGKYFELKPGPSMKVHSQ